MAERELTYGEAVREAIAGADSRHVSSASRTNRNIRPR